MFDLYFAGVTSDSYGVNKFLYSQYNDRSTIKKLRPIFSDTNVKLFLDSGAWTAFTKGVSINIDEYISYINTNNDIISVAVAVDVLPKGKNDAVDAANKSWDNFIYMRKHVIDKDKLIPVFHQAEPFKNLSRILEYSDEYGKIKYMGIGALANTKDYETRNRFISQCFLTIKSIRPDIKVHGFGMTDLRLLELYPFDSADSTTWRMAAIMGEIITKWGRIIISDKRKNDSLYALHNITAFNNVAQYVKTFDYNLQELVCDAEKRAAFNIAYLKRWEETRKCYYGELNKVKRLF